MPRPMYRSRSYRRLQRVTPSKRQTIHYKRRKNSFPHCAICGRELNGISINGNAKGRTLKTTARKFGGVLCSSCNAEVIKLASRIENGEMKLNSIAIGHKQYVLQMIAH